jgi:hypothetical protein
MQHRLNTRISRVFLAAAALAALSASGCGVVYAGDHDATTEFLVKPHTDGTYFGWSEITIQQDASSVKGATLVFARLEIPEDSTAPDLTFIQSIFGELVIKDGETYVERQPAAQKSDMPKDETIVPLDLLYEGDLRKFFPDGHTVRMEWTGTRNPAVEIPEEGYWVDVRVRVNVQ